MKIHDLVTIKSPESMRTMLTDGMRLRTSGRNEQLVEDNDGDHQGKSRRQAGRMRYFFLIFVALTVILTAAPSAMPSLRGGSRMTPGSGSSFFTRLSGSPRKRLHEGNDNSRQGEEVGEGERIHVESPSSDSLDCSPSFLEKEEPRSKYDCGQMKEMQQLDVEFLGEGYFRNVYLITYDGQDVVYKMAKDEGKQARKNKERHRKEAVALQAVDGHRNIVGLLGLCGPDLVTEYFPNFMDKLLFESSATPIPVHRVLEMALDAARGLQALHEAPGGPIVHADLQPRQLLLDNDGVVKINDLNRCRFMGRDQEGNSCPFTISKSNGVWRSPEEYAGKDLTEKLDVYSMGLIFWAMLGRDQPFKRDKEHLYKERVLCGERPVIDPAWHEEFVQLFQDMWHGDASMRPSAGQAAVRLEVMLAEFSEDDKD